MRYWPTIITKSKVSKFKNNLSAELKLTNIKIVFSANWCK